MRLKNRVFSFVLAAAVAAGLFLLARQATASVSVSVGFFYHSLAPYGDWITVGRYGRCWRPSHVAVGWQPYLHGRWIDTDAGWTWVSFDPWGGDPYHYGTWVYTAEDGWVWIPGTVWAPAWVTWCISDDYLGWAPVPPSFVVGTVGYSGPALTVSRREYVFVPARNFAGADVSSVRVPAAQNATFIARSHPSTRFAVRGGVLSSGGPAVSRVERVSGTRIRRVSFGQAGTKAVPIRTSLQESRGRAPVVVSASQRARLIAPPSPRTHAARQVSGTRKGPVKIAHVAPRSPNLPKREPRERTVHAAATPHKSEPRERTVHKAPAPHPSQHPERIAHAALPHPSQPHVSRSAPVAHVTASHVAQPRGQRPPRPAHGNPHPTGGESDKEHRKGSP